MDGRCIAYYSAYEFALGIKSVTWSPSSQFLAIGSFDQKASKIKFSIEFHVSALNQVLYLIHQCRVLNHITWKVVAEHNHPNTLDTETVVTVY